MVKKVLFGVHDGAVVPVLVEYDHTEIEALREQGVEILYDSAVGRAIVYLKQYNVEVTDLLAEDWLGLTLFLLMTDTLFLVRKWQPTSAPRK